jgi:hypothetical protein
MIHMDEGRNRVLAIAAAILVARHLKNPEDLHESRPSPRTESLIASAVQWAERIMRTKNEYSARRGENKVDLAGGTVLRDK